MRTLIWSAAAAVVLGIAGMWAGARYVKHHPASFVGRSAGLAYRLGAEYNPVAVLARAAEAGAVRVGRGGCHGGCCGPQESPPMTESAGAARPRPSCADGERLPDGTIADPADGPVEEEEPPAEENKENVIPPAPTDRKAPKPEAPPQASPPADDAEAAPAVMPRAKDGGEDGESEAIMNFWQMWLGTRPAAKESGGPKDDVGVAEESEPFHDPNVPECREDANYPRQYPGCPHTGRSPVKTGVIPDSKPMPKLTERPRAK